jgi:hypothetical protein
MRRILIALTFIGALAAPSAVAAKSSFDLAVCAQSDGTLSATLTWSGFGANERGVLVTFLDPQTSATTTIDFGDTSWTPLRAGTLQLNLPRTWTDNNTGEFYSAIVTPLVGRLETFKPQTSTVTKQLFSSPVNDITSAC